MTVNLSLRQQLFDLLLQHSFRRGEFVLSSGKTSNYYMDGRMTTLSAEGARLIGEILFAEVEPLGIQAIGGMTLGADPIVSAVTVVSAQKGKPINGFLVRKEPKGHGTARQIEGHLQDGDRVVLVEDVVTTGASFLKAIDAVHRHGTNIEIVGLFALVDRHEGGEEALKVTGIPYHPLFSIDAFLQAHT